MTPANCVRVENRRTADLILWANSIRPFAENRSGTHLGEYYTPSWLVEHMLDRLEYRGGLDESILDPACGSGNFFLAAIRRIRRRWESQIPPVELADKIAENVVGFDLNPIAVLTARANYLLAVGDLLELENPPGAAGYLSASAASRLPKIPVYLRDTILEADGHDRQVRLCGRKPALDRLGQSSRRVSPENQAALASVMGCSRFPATDARHGGGKKDLSMLMTYVCADRSSRRRRPVGIRDHANAFSDPGRGDGFRRFRLGDDGPPLGVLHVDDMVGPAAVSRRGQLDGTIFLEKGGDRLSRRLRPMAAS